MKGAEGGYSIDMPLSRVVARPLLASMFIAGGVDAFSNPDGKVKAAEAVTGPLTESVPALASDPRTLVRINGGVQVGAGLLLASGRFRRIAAIALIGSIIPTTYAGHRFWEEPDDDTRAQQRTHFLKNGHRGSPVPRLEGQATGPQGGQGGDGRAGRRTAVEGSRSSAGQCRGRAGLRTASPLTSTCGRVHPVAGPPGVSGPSRTATRSCRARAAGGPEPGTSVPVIRTGARSASPG